MNALSSELRNRLAAVIKTARREAEAGARKALEALAVPDRDFHASMTVTEKAMRTRLRAHGRQLGDKLDRTRGTQEITRLAHEVAYEHWHRMLFARFLAENRLLIEPESDVAISMAECEELAREAAEDSWALAARFAERMLPRIFRPDDPVLQVALAPEVQQALERLVASLPNDLFTADDALGWTYQFWQAERKDEVNASGVKIAADELPAVTQIFTEGYMVLFLLHNTLGAWWAAKLLASRPEVAANATSEEELRAVCSVRGVEWTYLRFLRDDGGTWRPSAGRLEGWPREAKDLRILDPCMGSGHFLVSALAILAALRVEEEGLPLRDALREVLASNVFGLEIDPRCTQIAAFNLALTAWRLGGYQVLPPLNLASSGHAINAGQEEWLTLAGDNPRSATAMKDLYRLFEQASSLGSLIDPILIVGDLFAAEFPCVRPLLEQALASEEDDEPAREMAVAARGVFAAADILVSRFTLVTTNVPYLGRGKQASVLAEYCEAVHPAAKADLATCFVERCLRFCAPGGTTALVTPQNWWFLGSYRGLRRKLLTSVRLTVIATLGEEAWQAFGDRGPVAGLMTMENSAPESSSEVVAIDALPQRTIEDKKRELHRGELFRVQQTAQYANPDHRITTGEPISGVLLQQYASCVAGILNGDSPRFQRVFWEFPCRPGEWVFQQTTVEATSPYGGRELLISFDEERGHLREDQSVRRDRLHNSDQRGNGVWNRWGVAVSQMRSLPVTLYSGEKFDSNVAIICPRDQAHLPAIWAFCSSGNFAREVRRVDKKVNVTNASLVKVPFDLNYWERIAAEQRSLPRPHSKSPTQWLFGGDPADSEQPLQAAVARLLGYRWPRQTGAVFSDCGALAPDALDAHASTDGIECFASIRERLGAAERLRGVLAAAFGSEWSTTKLSDLLVSVGFRGATLEDWLRDGFFWQHCATFHHRPFVWHVWDGRADGFHALVNYHRLVAADGEGRRTLETLTYSYVGEWIERQRAEQRAGVDGADGRLAAAQDLHSQLERILAGEPPFDLFVRWKPLHRQPIGWEPDINDGVRLNIRPFQAGGLRSGGRKGAGILRWKPNVSWGKDRGTETQGLRPKADFPWFWGCRGERSLADRTDFFGGSTFDGNRWNDLHYTNAAKRAARERAQGDTQG
jgi:hypothetical protein